MKYLKISLSITGFLGFLSVFALVFLFLALSDIADQEPDLTLEWYVAGISLMTFCAFTISTFITLGFMLRLKVLSKGLKIT